MSHTPGPWEVSKDGYALWGPFPARRHIGEVFAADRTNAEAETRWSNARLIAAAPDLLAACETTLASLAAESCVDPDDDPLAVLAAVLRVAIAKARGT